MIVYAGNGAMLDVEILFSFSKFRPHFSQDKVKNCNTFFLRSNKFRAEDGCL